MRALSILKRKKAVIHKVQIKHPKERELAVKLLAWFDLVEDLTKNYQVHLVTEYLMGLADLFNNFYEKCRVIGSENEKTRLALVKMTEKVFREAFDILGIEFLEKM